MARKLRLQFQGALYHLSSHGNRHEIITRDDQDRQSFFDTFSEACTKTGWQVHALCLLPTRFHLVLRTPEPNLVSGMKWFLGTYTNRFNHRHQSCGHLFHGRYHSQILDDADPILLQRACDFVHLAPARAGAIDVHQSLPQYPWSTWPHYTLSGSIRPAWLCMEPLQRTYGLQPDDTEALQKSEFHLEQIRNSGEMFGYMEFTTGWFVGSEKFRTSMLQQASKSTALQTTGPIARQLNMDTAEQLVQQELSRRGWKDVDLAASAKGLIGKIEIAEKLRKETTVSMEWICRRLYMGSVNYLNNRLYLRRKGLLPSPIPSVTQ